MKFSLKSTFTFWAVLFFIIICALQLIPWTGIFLMFFGAPIWTGYVLHIIALSLFVDMLSNKAPKHFLLVPLFPYGLYYLMFFHEAQNIKNIEHSIQYKNPSEIIAYNPEIHSLVMNENITKEYKVPVVYSLNRNFLEGFLSHRLATRELCNQAKDSRDSIYTFGVSWSRFGKDFYYKDFPNICDLRMPDRPDKKILRVQSLENEDPVIPNLRKISFAFYLEQELLGNYVSAVYERLPKFPNFFIGCSLISSTPAWKCYFQIRRERIILDTFPNLPKDGVHGLSAVARLLKIEKYTEAELQTFADYPETKERLLKLAEGKDNKDEWGLRRDSLYQPTVGEKKGFPSFEGIVHERNKGGHFYDFIKAHEGKIVYIDIKTKMDIRRDTFQNYGVCKQDTLDCNYQTVNTYQFKNRDGSPYYFENDGKFTGFFLVGFETPFENKYNKGNNDTVTILTVIPPEELEY